jgi:hypothetical protein
MLLLMLSLLLLTSQFFLTSLLMFLGSSDVPASSPALHSAVAYVIAAVGVP